MKRVLILGAGMVAKPIVRYLLENGFEVTVATRTVSKAEVLVGSNPRGRAERWTVDDKEKLHDLVKESEVVVSLLPYIYHVEVAQVCLEYKKHLVTTSYVKENMQALDLEARKKGVILLNELGLDPGIDHMSAMKMINKIKENNGKVVSFRSYCGALPAPEYADNPFKYKFSWSPKGAVLAAKNDARFLIDGKEIYVPGEELFNHCFKFEVDKLGEFEVYPNRDSIPYKEKYRIEDTRTIFRGTIRYPGWCNLWNAIKKLSLLDEREMEFSGITWKKLVARLNNLEGENLIKESASHLGLSLDSEIIQKLKWVGIFEDKKIEIEKGTPLDAFVKLLEEKLCYKSGEKDMVILRDEVIADYGNYKKRYLSVLIDYGEVGKETSVARTVALPAAVGVKLILENRITLKGVRIPVEPEIYEPVLSELEKLGITLEEKEEEIG